MKRILFLLAISFTLLAPEMARASNDTTSYGMGCGGIALNFWSKCFMHGPLYNYGPYYGYPPFQPYGPWNQYLQYTPPAPLYTTDPVTRHLKFHKPCWHCGKGAGAPCDSASSSPAVPMVAPGTAPTALPPVAPAQGPSAGRSTIGNGSQAPYNPIYPVSYPRSHSPQPAPIVPLEYDRIPSR